MKGDIHMKHRLLCMILCSIFLLLSACNSKPTPEQTLHKLEASFNDCNIEGVVECFEPSVQKLYDGIISAGGSLLGDTDLKTLLNVGGSVANILGDELVDGSLPELSVTVNSSTKLSDERVRVNATFNYTNKENSIAERTFDMDLVYTDKTWLIAISVDHSYDDKVSTSVTSAETSSSISSSSSSPPSLSVPDESSADTIVNNEIYNTLSDEIKMFKSTIVLNGGVDIDTVSDAVTRLIDYNPDIFWVEDVSTVYDGTNTTVTLSILNNYDTNTLKKMSDELGAKTYSILHQIPEDYSDYDKMLYIHDYLVNNTEYDTAGFEAGVSGTWSTVYGCLVQGMATCLGYSKAFQYLMMQLGIESGICYGESYTRILHSWNYVCLNKKYYWVDVTWDDPTSETGDSNKLCHTYFLINDNLLKRTRTFSDKNNLWIPTCSSFDDNYFSKNGSYLVRYKLEDIDNILYAHAQDDSVEIMFATESLYNLALNKLFNENEIWNTKFFQDSQSSISYSTDDKMYTLTFNLK